jgi:hypothetical protein
MGRYQKGGVVRQPGPRLVIRDVHNGLRVLTAGQPRSPLGDEIKQDVYFIERQSEFRRNGKFR